MQLIPGEEAKVNVRSERRHRFHGRVPVEVRGLPFGVQVLDNGTLITENETQRSFTLKAEPWVQPLQQPIVVLAKREGKKPNTPLRHSCSRFSPRTVAGKE